jgi:outer membrane murein-binding lipoprotein Lpp
MGMTEREELTAKIAQLEARRTELMADEDRLHNAFMKEDDEAKANRIATDLQDICGELDEIGVKIGIAKAKLYLIEAQISRREFLEDHPVGGARP